MKEKLDNLILGMTWEQIQARQRRQATPTVDTTRRGDYGADPLGDGLFRMVPSGDVVDGAERTSRLKENLTF